MAEKPQTKPVIGLVGGIGAGKSTVGGELARIGCALVDADAIGHELLSDPQIARTLRHRWGEAIFTDDGGVDRAALGKFAFADPAELSVLNSILHPAIGEKLAESIRRALADASVPAVAVDAAVLFEAGWNDMCTQVVFVDAPDELRFDRVHRDRGWNKKKWIQREKAQISLDKKRRLCDYTIVCSSSVSHLREQVRELYFRFIHVVDCPE
jgi:dephospho-CoA kinase